MKRFGKKWIRMNDDVQEEVSEVIDETKEEKEMGFFSKHKKGILIGGLGALAATAVGIFALSKKDSDDDYEDYSDDFDDEEVADEKTTEDSES